MRSTILIRCGLASLLIGGGIGGIFASGCGGDDNGATNNGQDSGPDGSNQPGDDGSTTTNPDSGSTTHADGGDAGPDAAPAPTHGKLLLVHASAGAPPLRFCFGISTGATDAGNAVTVPPTFPAPNTALGLPPGTGGSAADSTMDLANYNITVYGIISSALATQTPDAGASELTCKQLIGAAALGVDAGGLDLTNQVFNLGTMPAGTLADETTTLALVTGCAPGITDPHDSLVECPSGYSSATGDLGLSFVKLDTTTSFDGGALGAQFVYASTPFSVIAESAGDSTGSVNAGFYTSTLVPFDAGTPDAGGDAGDAGAGDAAVEASAPVLVPSTAFTLVAPNVTNGQLAPATLVSVPLSSLDFAGHSGFTAGVTGADGGPAFALSLPLPTIQALSNPGSTATTSEFAGGGGFVFVLVGDPSLPNFVGVDGGALPQDAGGAFNTQVAHFLAFPVDPPFGN